MGLAMLLTRAICRDRYMPSRYGIRVLALGQGRRLAGRGGDIAHDKRLEVHAARAASSDFARGLTYA